MSMINWFPGHMAKSLNDITKVKNLDLLIEVLDTRAITASSNEALINKFNKPVLKIALKKDLSDVIENNNVLIGSINDKNFKNKIFKKIDEFLKGKKEKLIKKGLLHPQFYIMVVGLPNIGKSSLINFLSNKNKVEVANKPGVTRTKQVIKLNEQYFIYDTPGILFKNIESDEIGYKLSLIGAIKKEILPINDISKWAYEYLMVNYKNEFCKKMIINNNTTYNDFLNILCEQYKFKLANNINDTQRAINYFYDSLINGKIIKVNYEKK